MANLRTAAAEIENAKKITRSSWEDSTYRQKIEDALKAVAPGLAGDKERLDQAVKFFKPEWEIRSQKFIKRFMMWTKTRGQLAADLAAYSKFGNHQVLNVAAIANNLNITFPAALFQVVQLVALGLARRVEPHVSTRGDPVFNISFAARRYMQFFLQVMDEVDGDFDDQNLHDLAERWFFKEIADNQVAVAYYDVSRAMQAKREYEENLKGSPRKAIGDLCRALQAHLMSPPVVEVGLTRWAQWAGIDPALALFCAFIVVLTDEERVFARGPGGGIIYSGPKVEPKTVDIGSLSTSHAKEVLRAAAAQSPTNADPIIPAGNTVWTEQVKLQAQIDVLRDQVAVLMKLAGVGSQPKLVVHTAPPEARKTAKRGAVAAKKPKKVVTKATKKKPKRRR